AFERAVYPAGHPRRPVAFEEAEQAIGAITREDVEGFYRRQYGPDRLILVIAGDVRASRVHDAVRARLESWPRNPQARPPPARPVPLQPPAPPVVIPLPDKSQTAILWGHAGGLRRSDPDFYAAQVMNVVLGGGGALNSRLGTVIRDEQGLAYNVESFFEAGFYPRPFQEVPGTNPAQTGRAIEALVRNGARLHHRGVTRRGADEGAAY